MLHSRKTKGVLLAAVLIVSAALLLTACSDNQAAANGPEEPVRYENEGTRPETQPPVEVAMPEYTFSYSGELADIIIMEELPAEDPRDLEFQVKLSSGEYTIFTLGFNSDEGDLVTMLPDAKGNKIPVAFEMTAVPENLTEEDHRVFCYAQESVNEIVASLKLK